MFLCWESKWCVGVVVRFNLCVGEVVGIVGVCSCGGDYMEGK